jgi:hypothetical protein
MAPVALGPSWSIARPPYQSINAFVAHGLNRSFVRSIGRSIDWSIEVLFESIDRDFGRFYRSVDR